MLGGECSDFVFFLSGIKTFLSSNCGVTLYETTCLK